VVVAGPLVAAAAGPWVAVAVAVTKLMD
jgi:hypothetical protein